MILPTARRRGICIRTLGRRLRKDSTKERPSVNDGGTRKKKGRREKLRENNLGVYRGVMVVKLKMKGWPKFTHTYESAEEPPRTEKKAAEKAIMEEIESPPQKRRKYSSYPAEGERKYPTGKEITKVIDKTSEEEGQRGR